MLGYDQIKEYFDTSLVKKNPKGILVEYLQHEFLDSLFKQPGAQNLSFIGGTAVRIIYGSERFSEDLDFDNFGLDYQAFKMVAKKALAEMRLKGFTVETKYLSKKQNYHLYVRFPDLLFKYGITGHREEKVFIAIDTQKKEKIFQPEVKVVNKFGIFRNIQVNPVSVLLSQKLLAILYRAREKGRDFYDASYLSGRTKADFTYIKKMTGLNREEFTAQISARCEKLNFKELAKDVEPFLFDPDQKDRVLSFMRSLPIILKA
ncbi:MAG: nucleotidyl transferase AbiEii/AbiGii toxin family protein [bacterium]